MTNSEKIELASTLAHNQLVKDYRALYSEEELQNPEEPETYRDEVQDSFDELYDYFCNEIDEIVTIKKEQKVYVLDSIGIDTNPSSKDFNSKEFIEQAEEEGRIYSLQGFVNAFNNNDEINQDTDYAIIN